MNDKLRYESRIVQQRSHLQNDMTNALYIPNSSAELYNIWSIISSIRYINAYMTLKLELRGGRWTFSNNEKNKSQAVWVDDE